jgi:hypothetical protein
LSISRPDDIGNGATGLDGEWRGDGAEVYRTSRRIRLVPRRTVLDTDDT